MADREVQKQSTRERIFETATSLFMSSGYEDTSVADITKKAGVAKGTFFVHFPSKATILGELGRDQLSRALDVIEGAERMSTWPFDRQIEHVFRTLARSVDQSPEQAKLWVEWASKDAAAREIRRAEDDRLKAILASVVKTGKRGDQLRADVLADRMATHLLGIYDASLRQWCDRGGNYERWLMESVRLTLDGLRPRA